MPFIQQVKLMRHPEREAAETEDAEAEDVAAAKKANGARLHCAIGSTLLAAVKERNILG